MYLRYLSLLSSIVLTVFLTSCNFFSSNTQNSKSKLFTSLDSSDTGISFVNRLTEGLNTNVLMYQYFYNGGGVAVADVNGDGLDDIYFTGNLVDNKLYLNKGSLNFEDITKEAAVAGRAGAWKTGVTMADINGDGLTDIFVCYSGKMPNEKRLNQLFINQGNNEKGIPHFEDQAKAYGLTAFSFTTQAYFFDYDRDGDLDMLELNDNPDDLTALDESQTITALREENKLVGVRLFRNDNNHFTDITGQTGISSTMLTYGLGAGIADINMDGWPDIYISNDYNVTDYLYINNKNGTFTDKLQESMGHISQASMGDNVADINNDALPDIYTLDMLPEDNYRQKILMGTENYEKFRMVLRQGFYYQYMRNMLHLNNGDGSFSEIGQLAGISNTDWSWAPLFADFDNDGWKDLYVTNGYRKDYTDRDFIKFMNDYVQSKGRLNRTDVMEILKEMPASNVNNYVFRNTGNLTFQDVSKDWGVSFPSNSNGAAYSDLDNDGDVDLVINTNDQPAIILRNDMPKGDNNHSLSIKLSGSGKNTDGLGTKVFLYTKDKQQYLEQMPARGFQSSVTPVLHFGVGADTLVDSVRVVWLTGKQQVLRNVKANQRLVVNEKNAMSWYQYQTPQPALFKEIASPIAFSHRENNINDFKRQPLMCNPLSFSGPCLAKADVNGDQLEDVYVGGNDQQGGKIYIQDRDGTFKLKPQPAMLPDSVSDDADAVFFDANQDGKVDLYVAGGGYHSYMPQDVRFQDRLYLNDGKGNFTRSVNALPPMHTSKGCIAVADINGDGFMDVFAGGRVLPGEYPQAPASYVLINDGKGHFTDQTKTIAPELGKAGLVTSAVWTDLNLDKKADLILAGEWMPISVYINEKGKLINRTKDYFDKEYSGWWNKVWLSDLNGDGKQDLVAGNLGLNAQCKASDKEPAELFYKDFDNNGAIDPIFCFYIQGESYPYVTRDELLDQIIGMRTRFTSYKSYGKAKLKDIFTPEELKGAKRLTANTFSTMYFETGTDHKFHAKPLPPEAQFAPVYTITNLDYNKDGRQDLLLCGNMNQARLRMGKSDANYGVLLKNEGGGKFSYVSQQKSGFHLRGDVRSVLQVNNSLLFGINQKAMKAYTLAK